MSEVVEASASQSTPVGKLPANWHFLRLQEIVPESRHVTYGIVQPGIHDPQGVLLIRGQDYIKGWAEPDAFFRVARPLHEAFKRSLTVAGDLLICIVGATTGATNVVPSWIKEANITQTTARIACDSRKADAHFVLYALASELGQMQVRKYIKGSAQPGMNLADVERFVVPAPPLSEQRKVALILTTLDNLIGKTEALIAKYQAIKQGMMHDLFTRGIDADGRLRPPQTEAPDLYKQSELGWIPNEWQVLPLSAVAYVGRGKFTPRPRDDPKFYGGSYPFIQTGDVANAIGHYLREYSQTLNKLGTSVSKEFPTGTIVLTIAANIADTAILAIPMYLPDSICGIIVNPTHNIRFIELCLRKAKHQLDSRAPQSAQKNINLGDLRPLLIPSPTPDEQERIAAVYETNDTVIETGERLLSKRKRQKTGLTQDLLTGKVRVKVDELEEVADA